MQSLTDTERSSLYWYRLFIDFKKIFLRILLSFDKNDLD